MVEKEHYPDVFHYLWNLGYILTTIMKISRSNDVPILVESFKAASDLFDVLGAYNYGVYRKQGITDALKSFTEELNKKHNLVYESTIQYSWSFTRDLIQFLKENDIS